MRYYNRSVLTNIKDTDSESKQKISIKKIKKSPKKNTEVLTMLYDSAAFKKLQNQNKTLQKFADSSITNPEEDSDKKVNMSLQFTQKFEKFKKEMKAIVLNGNSDHLDNDSNSPLLSQNYKLKTSYISPSKLICNEKK